MISNQKGQCDGFVQPCLGVPHEVLQPDVVFILSFAIVSVEVDIFLS